jgi:hypothetical protein
MTWAQFKQELESRGVTDNAEIRFIDVHYPVRLLSGDTGITVEVFADSNEIEVYS